MTQYPQYLRYLEEAKREEVADTLRSEGFEVETEKVVTGGVKFDLFAEKDGRGRVYEFKSVGSKRLHRNMLVELQQSAKQSGYEFHIVIVNPPPKVKVEIDRLKSELLSHALDTCIDALDSLSTHTRIEGIADLEISDVRVSRTGTKVKGSGTIEVTLQYGSESDDGASLNDAYPFAFSVSLEPDNSLASVEEFEVDTTSFYE